MCILFAQKSTKKLIISRGRGKTSKIIGIDNRGGIQRESDLFICEKRDSVKDSFI